MAIESKNLLVAIKAYSRGNALPLDASEVYESLAEATAYASSATAYAGQTIKALVGDKYKTYTLQPSDAGYTLEEVGAVSASDIKQYVQVVDSLPTSGQQQGVIYITGTTGQIWTGTAWRVVFKEVSAKVDELSDTITEMQEKLDTKAPLANPAFTGKVTVNGNELAEKSYVDGLIASLTDCTPGVVGTNNPLPSDYKAGQTFRVADAGTYAGQKCEVGDLIICLANYNADTASNNDFMVVQANIDGAVTSAATTSTVGEIVVFNSNTGKVIKGSGVNILSLNDAIAKAHTHSNMSVLNSYDKTQTALLAAAKTEAQTLVDALEDVVDGKADKATTLAGYGITDAYTKAETDAKDKVLSDNINTKVDSATVDSKIDTATDEITAAYTTAIADRIGEIPDDTTVKSYIDTAVGSGGTASAEAIAQAKQEAINASKEYTNTTITNYLTVTEF